MFVGPLPQTNAPRVAARAWRECGVARRGVLARETERERLPQAVLDRSGSKSCWAARIFRPRRRELIWDSQRLRATIGTTTTGYE
jgi:hypothetical protein